MKRIVVLGITGSVGSTTIKVLRRHPDLFSLTGFSYHGNFETAKSIATEFRCTHVCCTGNISADERDYWKAAGVSLLSEMSSLVETDFESLLSAVVGAAGVPPAMKAAELGKTILLANKESLVMAGEFLTAALKKSGGRIIPVDSEHNSLFRLLQGRSPGEIHSLLLTASGGPFREFTPDQIRNAGKKDVLNHPTWSMGQKITVDSAGMINKALEIMEARHLFSMEMDRIRAVIHPQSIVHACLRLSDGSLLMHTHPPDMIFPVAHSLFYPDPVPEILPYAAPSLYGNLTFAEIEKEKFPGYFLGREAAEKGGCFPTIFNAANEAAVEHFLNDRIRFRDIPVLIADIMGENPFPVAESLAALFEADTWARRRCGEKISSYAI